MANPPTSDKLGLCSTVGKLPEEETRKADIAGQLQGDGWTLVLAVYPDRMTASLQLCRASLEVTCPPEAIVAFVRGSKLRLSSDENTQLADTAASLAMGATTETRIVARGKPAGEWKEIDWLIPMGLASVLDYSGETVDLHEVTRFINVRAGQPLCEVSATPETGVDVFGGPVYPSPCPFHLGERVGLDPRNPSRVVATEAGCARFAGGRLSIEQHLEVPGDLDFKIGNIDFFGDVTIRGSVFDDFRIRSTRNVTIGGGVGMSVIEAAGSITIKGGVNGGHKGKLMCGGNLQAHYLHMVSVECGGDVMVDVECHDSRVFAEGSVTVSRGGIIGGKVYAGKNIGAGSIGTEMCVPTILRAGHDNELDGRVEKPRKVLASARVLIRSLESAIHNCVDRPGSPRRFPSQYRTQVIQLQSRLADARVVESRARAEVLSHVRGVHLPGATISSAKRIFPKALLVIDSICEEEVANEISGPVCLGADPAGAAITPVSKK